MTNGANAARDRRVQDGPAIAAEAATAPKTTPGLRLEAKAMLKVEDEFLWPNGKPSYRAGLALSGGGVRAATVALGVIEVLAESELLQRIHYMSTVSGGGYLGCALSWFWCQRRVDAEKKLSKEPTEIHRFGAEAKDFPFQSKPEDSPPIEAAAGRNLNFLRLHGSYLTSGDGIGFAGLIMAVLRTVLLSLAVWLPLLVALFLGIEMLDGLIVDNQNLKRTTATGFAVLNCRPTYQALLIVSALVGEVFYVGVVLFAFLSRFHLVLSPGEKARRPIKVIVVSILVGLGMTAHIVWQLATLDPIQPAMGAQLIVEFFCVVGTVLIAGPLLSSAGSNWGYFLRRSFEKFSNYIMPIAMATTFIGTIPVIVASLTPDKDAPAWLSALGPIGGVLTLLSGVGTALYGYYLKAKSLLPGVAGELLAVAGSLLFFSGLLIFSFTLAHMLISTAEPAKPINNYLLIACLSLVALAILIGALGSLNATGLHRFYRDRLMETFMPMTDAVKSKTAQESDVADTLTLAEVVGSAGSAEERGNRPYHLINAHAILINEPKNPKLKLRGGDNFLISPAIIGSGATGWMRMADYLRLQGPLTLASAMAASGAAANANAGYIGTGVTRDRFLSIAMSILNIRLGLWVTNPGWLAKRSSPTSPQRLRPPTYFQPGLTAGIFGLGHNHESKFVELSDGGHFENLGLYELVRRRTDLIIVVDAEQDKQIHLSSLVSSMNRVKEDFDTEITFDCGKGPELLLGQESTDEYPRGLDLARSPFIVGQIKYPEKDGDPNKSGILIYMKSTMVKGLQFTTLGYRAINPDFPHQTTADQFFDPDQFQAYRDLGRQSCEIMVNALDLKRSFDRPAELLKAYQRWPLQR